MSDRFRVRFARKKTRRKPGRSLASLSSNEKEIPLITETVGFEPTCPCGQLDFESSSL